MTKRHKPFNVKPKYEHKDKSPKGQPLSEQITTLHGVNYLAVKKGRSLIVWILLMVANIFGSIAFLVIIKDRYHSDQIVTKIYSDWSVDKVPFPAVTICNYNIVSLNESRTIENILLKYDVPKTEIDSFFQDLYFLSDFGQGSADVQNHSEVINILKKHYYNIEIIMEQLYQKCEDALIYCSFNGKQKNCMDLFTKIKTYAGYCCSFNFDGLEDDNFDPMVSLDEDMEYYIDQAVDGEDTLTSMVATSQSGSSSGLRVVFNVDPKDYASWALTPGYGAKVMISDPNDYIETRLSYEHITIGEAMDIKVEPMILQSEDDLRHVDVAKRGCWFPDEVKLVHTDRYSYETCSTECKSRSYKDYCGCVPYKYPIEKSTRICEFSDLKCLNYMKVHWEATKTPCDPICYKECRDKAYYIVSDTFPFISEDYPTNVTSGRNVSELAALRVYYLESSCNCYMMSLLTDTNTFIATYGGLFSLYFGASIITLCELSFLSFNSLARTSYKYFNNK